MTINAENTSEQPDMKTVDLDALMGPEIVKPEGGIILPATHRCEKCGAQAWVEVEAMFTRTTLHLNTEAKIGSGEALMATQEVAQHDATSILFCAHHYRESEAAIMRVAKRIVDYRDVLVAQEKAGGPAL